MADAETTGYVESVAPQNPAWGKFVAAQGVAWVSAAVGAGIYLLSEAVLEDKQRWMPSIDAVPWLMVLLALSSFFVLLGWMAIRRPLRGARRRALIAVAWVLGQLAASTGATAAILAADHELLFGPSYVDRVVVPGGGQTVYLYKTGFFCGYELYVKGEGSWVLNRVRKIDRKDCGSRTANAHLEWRGGEGVLLLDEHGELLSAQPHDFSGLWLGPH